MMLHTRPPVHSLSGSVLAVTVVQVPFGMPVLALVQASQVPVHAALQHTPSAQKPLAHSDAIPHASPGPFLQEPAPLIPLQTCVPAHSLSGSVPASRGAHVPSAAAVLEATHASHKPLHATLQQTPSTQKVLMHSPAAPFVVQAEPADSLVQAPAPLQLVTPTHSFAGSWPLATLVQVPMAPEMLHA